MKSTQRVPSRLGPYNCFRNRQNTEIKFSNAACCFFVLVHVEIRVGHVDCECAMRLLETQVVEDASHARNRTWSGHDKHCLVTNEFSCDESCSDSAHSVVQIPTCHHQLLPKNHTNSRSRTLQTLRMDRVMSDWPPSLLLCPCCQEDGPAILQHLRDRRNTLQNLILNSRKRNFNHRHVPNVNLRTFASRMLCLW